MMSQSRARSILYVLASLVALVGLAEAIYLTVNYLTGEAILCGDSTDCGKVLGSKYAKIFHIPLAAVGALAYLVAFTFATFGAFGQSRARLLFALHVSTMFAVTLWLLYLQAFVIHAFCRYCLFSAALVFLLVGLSIASSRYG
jgi:uncharacterized membrane protein